MNAPTYEEFYSRRPVERPKPGEGKDDYALHVRRFTEEQLAEAERRAGDLTLAE